MRIIATCMAANESDIVEAFVRHNLGFLDALVVLDHASTDSTPAILASLVAEGLPVVVLHDPDRAYRQDQRQTYLARRFLAELDADFCFAIDADEFLKVPSRARLEQALAALPEGSAGAIALQNYVGPEGAAPALNPVERLTHRLRAERSAVHKVVVGRRFAAESEAHISFGNHAVVRVRDGRAEPLVHARVADTHIAHFPVRSPEQIACKALIGWLARRLAVPDGSRLASHWGEIFAGIAAGRIAIDAGLARDAVAWYVGGAGEGRPPPVAPDELVEDPLPCSYELRYTQPTALAPVATLAKWADLLVSDIKSGAFAPRP